VATVFPSARSFALPPATRLWTLRARVCALVLIALSPAVVLLVAGAVLQHGHEIRDIRNQTLAAVRRVASAESALMDEKVRVLRLLANVAEIRHPGTLCGPLLAAAASDGGFTNIVRVDESGRMLCSGHPPPPGFTIADLPHFKLAMAGEPYGVTDYLVTRSRGKPGVAVAVPVRSDTGQVIGVVSGAVDLDALSTLIARVQLPEGSTLGLFDAQGTIVMRYPAMPQVLGQNVAGLPMVRAAIAAEGEGTIEARGVDGVDRLYAYDRAPRRPGTTKDLHFTVGIPLEIAYAQVYDIVVGATVAIVVVALLVVMVAFLGLESFVGRPLRKLLEAARRFGAGDLEARTALTPQDGEVGLLGTTFDEMASTLGRRHAELEGARAALEDANRALAGMNQALEARVSQRTAELVSIKTQLETDIEMRRQAEAALQANNAELRELNDRLSNAQNQLLQSEKLASIGQLAAGVAHEINNPIGYVHSNLGTLERYVGDLLTLIRAYEDAEAMLASEARDAIRDSKAHADLAFLREDMLALLAESKEGVARVKKIVQDLKDFSRVGSDDVWQWADVHAGLDSTLNIVNNELKYKATIAKDYGRLPEVRCLPSQLNQVFMNLLVNAGHAIDGEGTITVRTGCDDASAWVEIEDTGCGIPPEHLPRIFDPFFTTKPVGKGTGLGLSLSYGIVRKHGGRIEVRSTPGVGSTFRVVLPLAPDEAAARQAPAEAL
jgi:signal transduction histidine kinase